MEYTISEMAKEIGEEYIKVYKRYTSKFADRRWGVEDATLPDGTIKKVVPAEKLYLWKMVKDQNINYQGAKFETDPDRTKED